MHEFKARLSPDRNAALPKAITQHHRQDRCSHLNIFFVPICCRAQGPASWDRVDLDAVMQKFEGSGSRWHMCLVAIWGEALQARAAMLPVCARSITTATKVQGGPGPCNDA